MIHPPAAPHRRCGLALSSGRLARACARAIACLLIAACALAVPGAGPASASRSGAATLSGASPRAGATPVAGTGRAGAPGTGVRRGANTPTSAPRPAGATAAAPASSDEDATSSLASREGVEVLGFENLEGVMLISATLRSRGGRDTTVRLVLDTGAGWLILDRDLARALELTSKRPRSGRTGDVPNDFWFAEQALPRLRFDTLEYDHVSPVLVFDATMVREVTDRPVDGLVGQALFTGRALQIDYRTHTLAVVPVAAGSTSVARDRESAPPGNGQDRSDAPAERTPPRRTGNGVAGAGSEGAAGTTPSGSAGTRAASVTGAADSASRAASAAGPAAPGGPVVADPPAVAASRGALEGLLSDKAVPLVFDLAGDGKIMVRARLSDPAPPEYGPWLNLVLDTGATKCVLFADAIGDALEHADKWRSLEGLAAPTLLGTETTRVVKIPSIEVAGMRVPTVVGAHGPIEGASSATGPPVPGRRMPFVTRTDVDAAMMGGPLGDALTEAIGRPVHGLLGYSFLRNYRLTIDYVNRVVWFEPQPADEERPYEYSHVGIQLARAGGELQVLAVVEGSPAALAGISPGDVLLKVDGRSVAEMDVSTASRALEGPPGTKTELVLRHDKVERQYRLERRWLL